MFEKRTIVLRQRKKTATAKELRRRMTSAEAILWEALRSRRFRKFKFRRQVPLGQFIVDFLCMPLHLIIEVDGGMHENQREHDTEREEHLRAFGYHIIRFRNEEICADLLSVLHQLEREIFKEHSSQNSTHPPSPFRA